MGFLRLVFIFIGISVCSELPSDGDGVTFFRSFFAFFIMLAFDYSRMAFRGKSKYEIGLGWTGLFYTVTQTVFCWLGTSNQLVIEKATVAYNIVSSDTFRLFPFINFNIDSYMQWTLYITLFVGALELLVPGFNRYSQKSPEEKKPETANSKWFFWRRKNYENIKPDSSMTETINGGGK